MVGFSEVSVILLLLGWLLPLADANNKMQTIFAPQIENSRKPSQFVKCSDRLWGQGLRAVAGAVAGQKCPSCLAAAQDPR